MINVKKIVAVVLMAVLFVTTMASCSVRQMEKVGDVQYEKDAYNTRLNRCVDYIRTKTDFEPEILITLGSGLGDLADKIDKVSEINYEDIPGFPLPTVEGHKGKLIFGNLCGKKVVCMQGRIHYYEGYEMWDVVLPLRVCGKLGAKTAILTTSVGAINKEFKAGEFMIANDCITTFVPSPLIGKNTDDYGERFPDMTYLCNRDLIAIAHKVADKENIPLHEGVFVQTKGPQFETPAEIKMLRNMGADTVSMSTGCEAIAAHHMGMNVCVINSISNMAAGILDQKLSDDDVKEISLKSGPQFQKLIEEMVKEI